MEKLMEKRKKQCFGDDANLYPLFSIFFFSELYSAFISLSPIHSITSENFFINRGSGRFYVSMSFRLGLTRSASTRPPV